MAAPKKRVPGATRTVQPFVDLEVLEAFYVFHAVYEKRRAVPAAIIALGHKIGPRTKAHWERQEETIPSMLRLLLQADAAFKRVEDERDRAE